MRVIKKPKLKKIVCSYCFSVLKIKHKDIEKSVAGYRYVVCPVCGNWNVRSDDDFFENSGKYFKSYSDAVKEVENE